MKTMLGLDAVSAARVTDPAEARRASAAKMPRCVVCMIRSFLGLWNGRGAIGQHTTVQDGIPGNSVERNALHFSRTVPEHSRSGSVVPKNPAWEETVNNPRSALDLGCAESMESAPLLDRTCKAILFRAGVPEVGSYPGRRPSRSSSEGRSPGIAVAPRGILSRVLRCSAQRAKSSPHSPPRKKATSQSLSRIWLHITFSARERRA